MRELTGQPLGPHTTLGVGGPARRMLHLSGEAEVVESVRDADARGEPLLVLGGGSNVVVSDQGVDATVVQIANRGIERRRLGDQVELAVAAGEPWDELVLATTDDGLAGIECLAGIPGRVGAAPVQNVGAYGQELADTLVRVRAYDRRGAQVVHLTAEQCGFGYRQSVFKGPERDRFVVLGVVLRLRRGDPAPPRYAELQRALTSFRSVSPSPAQVREAVLTLRRKKGMVVDDTDADSRSAGSFFVNPVVSRDQADAVEQRARMAGVAATPMPRFDAGADRVKLSAAWMIEHAGFRRGHVHGDVGLSSKHALAIINRGRGSAAEILELARCIVSTVQARFGVRLRPEPVFWGFPTATPLG